MPARSRSGDARPSAAASRPARARPPLASLTCDRLGPALDPRRPVGCGDLERPAGQLRDAAQQRPPDHPVLDDVAERLAADRAMIVVHRERRLSLADLDVQDRLRYACQVRPDADTFEQMARATTDRGDAAIERQLCGGRQRPLLDQQDRDAGAGQRARQRQAGHAAARDDHIEARFAVRHRPTVPQPAPPPPAARSQRFPLVARLRSRERRSEALLPGIRRWLK